MLHPIVRIEHALYLLLKLVFMLNHQTIELDGEALEYSLGLLLPLNGQPFFLFTFRRSKFAVNRKVERIFELVFMHLLELYLLGEQLCN